VSCGGAGLQADKEQLRASLLKRRREIPETERKLLSRRISEWLFSWPVYREAEKVHCFYSIQRNAEVETGPIIEQMIGDGKQVYLPRMLPSPGELEHIRFRGTDDIRTGRLGIPEPAGEERIVAGQLDLILVPMLGSDHQKQRLGYGLGYYDRFLATCTGCKTGLLFEAFIQKEPLPAGPHDIPLDYLITESGIV